MSKEQLNNLSNVCNNDTPLLYHAFVDKNISNAQQLAAVLSELVAGYLDLREMRLITALDKAGYSTTDVAKIIGRSREHIYQKIKKVNRKDIHVNS